MSDEILARHAAAESIASEAATVALSFFHARSDLITEAKASLQDVVSRADREVEDLIRTRIAALFPDDGLLGEEFGLLEGRSDYIWVIDPIDGTSPFLAGLPHWCVAIAVQHRNQTVLAVTHVPMAKEVFSARRGAGAFLNGEKLLLDDQATIQNSLTGLGASHRCSPSHVGAIVQALLQAGGAFYRNGSGAIMLASVAAGRLCAYYEPHMNSWDCLGGLLMIQEAGGITRPFGANEDLLGGDVVLAAAPSAWVEVFCIAMASPAA